MTALSSQIQASTFYLENLMTEIHIVFTLVKPKTFTKD